MGLLFSVNDEKNVYKKIVSYSLDENKWLAISRQIDKELHATVDYDILSCVGKSVKQTNFFSLQTIEIE
jgi:hypothetical protein